jgi:hypothetical protein
MQTKIRVELGGLLNSKSMGKVKTLVAAVAAISLVVLAAAPALAFEGGGRKPSEAPLVSVGQHYSGALNNHRDDTNYNGTTEVAFWHLPPLTTRDVVIIDWESAPVTNSPGNFPACLTLAQGVNDFNWGDIFSNDQNCDRPFGSGASRREVVVQEANSTSSYLEFAAYANRTNPTEYETYPYSFTVQPILHYLALAMRPVKRVSASGILRATANLATGGPAPDGLAFNLGVTWSGSGIASYTGLSSGGVVAFQLALPETAYGKQASFVVSHPADGTYQGVTTSKLKAKIAKPKTPPPSPCLLAERKVLSLKRSYKRIRRHAAHARGAARGVLHRKANRAKRKLRTAQSEADTTCASS